MRWRIGIRGTLLGVNAFVLLVPILSIALLRIYDNQLIRRTEAQLIAESVLIGEVFREEWLRETGMRLDRLSRIAPEGARHERYFPIEPALGFAHGVLPPTEASGVVARDRGGPEWAAGARVQPVMERAKLRNLSAARLLDRRGCVVASSGAGLGSCLSHLEEVREGLSGRYASVLRRRVLETSGSPIRSASRRGPVRIHTATPVLFDGQVIGVVKMSRTAPDPGRALWVDRRTVFVALAACVLLTASVSLFFSRSIARPLRALTRAARSQGRDGGRQRFEARGPIPAELRDLSEALDTMSEKLSQRARYIADFAANVSHELKNPITGVRGAAELLADEWPAMSDAERQRFLANIGKDAQRMEQLVSRLLHLARIESTREPDGEVELRDFVRRLVADYGGRVRLELGDVPERLRIQPEHLESALRNLLDNAVRHGGRGPVDLELRRSRGRVVFLVRDRGPGISEGNRSRIFDRFFTTDRERGGTGLGLAIARAVAEARGGSIDFDTGPWGTCFRLTV